MQNRRRTFPQHTHDFDIVAGPIADDKMRRQFDRYEMKEITMEQLLTKVTYREPTHQIMFATAIAVNIIQPNNDFSYSEIEDIITNTSIALMHDSNKPMIDAMNIVYNSNTFMRLIDIKTELYRYTWQEIYEMLKNELKR